MAIKQAEQSKELTEAMDPSENSSMSVYNGANALSLGEVGGETGAVIGGLPFLKTGFGQGKHEHLPKGCLILGEDNVLALTGEKLRITILTTQFYWKEYLTGSDYSPDVIPRRFATAQEVAQNGGTTDWTGERGARKAPSFKIAVLSKIIIQKPKDIVCGLFGVTIGGIDYAPAIWDVDKTSADKVAPTIKNDSMLSLRQRGMHSGIYELSTHSVKFPSGYSSYVPKLRLVDYHTDEVKKEIEEALAPCFNQTPVTND